jgi:hypothetical protein
MESSSNDEIKSEIEVYDELYEELLKISKK